MDKNWRIQNLVEPQTPIFPLEPSIEIINNLFLYKKEPSDC